MAGKSKMRIRPLLRAPLLTHTTVEYGRARQGERIEGERKEWDKGGREEVNPKHSHMVSLIHSEGQSPHAEPALAWSHLPTLFPYICSRGCIQIIIIVTHFDKGILLETHPKT